MLTTTEAAALLAERGYTVSRRRAGGIGPPSADTIKHWARDGRLKGAIKRENRWFIPRETIEELIGTSQNTSQAADGTKKESGDSAL
jgi:hypothetical protein